MRIVLAIATLLTMLAMAGTAIWSIAAGMPIILPIVTGLLTVGFGLFVYHDYQFFFGKKP